MNCHTASISRANVRASSSMALLGLPLLRVQIERDEREKRHGEHRRQSGKIDGLQTESMLPMSAPTLRSEKFAACKHRSIIV